MLLADLTRRTAVRLALGVTLFVLTALILSSAIGYSLLRGQLIARQDARITEIFTALQSTAQFGDQADLVEAATTRIAASIDLSTVYLLRGPTGAVLAANIPDIWYKPGWSRVEAPILGISDDTPYRVFTGTSGGFSIVVGMTYSDLDDLADISFAAFGWSALGVLLVAIGAGAFIAIRVQARISEVEATLHAVGHGDLTARLTVSRRGSDLDQISLAINQALARLESLVEAVRQVSADIAHDLRTPLNRLRIRIEAAVEANIQGTSPASDLAEALAQSDAIDQTFSALLRIAQIEAGGARANFHPLDLSDLIRTLAEVYADVAEDSGMTLLCDASVPAMVNGDKHLLTQMFANLIENAIRHCQLGTTITCEVRAADNQLVASIADTGPGIPEAERDNVLRRLYRLEKSRTTEGSGLGLALVKAVAEAHDATLALMDAGPGLRVSLQFATLPRA